MFYTNTDSYGGNSGSSIVNANTLEVEGILITGVKDYTFNSEKGCLESNVCKDVVLDEASCFGEGATDIGIVRKKLISLGEY